MGWDDDPFNSGDDAASGGSRGDRTIIRPSPGRSVAPGSPPSAESDNRNSMPPQAAVRPSPMRRDNLAGSSGAANNISVPSKLKGSGLNPLVDAATALLILGAKLRSTLSQDNVAGMQGHVARQIRAFEDAARAAGCEQNDVLTARYVLCTFLDECVLNTPWGGESQWALQSLLSTFHNETGGGEKFFQLLDRMLQEPSRTLNLLELMYLCLNFGFEGKYALGERGGTQLLEIQNTVYQTIANQRGDFERDLSPHWSGIQDGRSVLIRYVPFWVVAALAGVLLLVVYGGFRFILGTTTAPVYQSVELAVEEQRVELNQ